MQRIAKSLGMVHARIGRAAAIRSFVSLTGGSSPSSLASSADGSSDHCTVAAPGGSATQFTGIGIPFVIDRAGGFERTYDIYSRLLRDRIVCLHGPVNQQLASSIVAQLLFLESQHADRPIFMYINSPGGSVTDGMAIYDTMQFVRPPIITLCMGMAASMGSLLLTAGAPGQRFALPNARIMVHQPSGGAQGQASDIAIVAKEILRTRERLNRLYAEHTRQPVDLIERAMERDNYMTAEEALEFGLIDGIMPKNSTAVNARATTSTGVPAGIEQSVTESSSASSVAANSMQASSGGGNSGSKGSSK